MFRRIQPTILAAILIVGVWLSEAQAQQATECEPCRRPGALANFADSTMDVQFVDGTLLRGVRSAARTSMQGLHGPQQAYRFTYTEGGNCRDTIVGTDLVASFMHEGIGGTHDPLKYPALPAREVYNPTHVSDKRSFFEFTGLIGYAGSDTSARNVGFSSSYFALEGILAPLGDAFGDHWTAGIGGGALFEGGRVRFPLYLQLRYDLFSSGKVETVVHYLPDSCQFKTPETSLVTTTPSEFIPRPSANVDSSVVIVEENKLVRPDFRPFGYIEGGYMFDSKFAGSGTPSNAVNPDARKPLLLGFGIGIPIESVVILTLGYRYMQLHLATPCEQCVDRSVINRNTIHSITLKGAYRLAW